MAAVGNTIMQNHSQSFACTAFVASRVVHSSRMLCSSSCVAPSLSFVDRPQNLPLYAIYSVRAVASLTLYMLEPRATPENN